MTSWLCLSLQAGCGEKAAKIKALAVSGGRSGSFDLTPILTEGFQQCRICWHVVGGIVGYRIDIDHIQAWKRHE